MKIQSLCEIHFETDPDEIPYQIKCDVIVAAGDIGVGTEGIGWLKPLGKPEEISRMFSGFQTFLCLKPA